jgi:hypothetical protein
MFDPNANQNVDPNLGNTNQDPTSAYGSLDSDKRSLVAQAFIQRLAGKQDDPQAQQYGNLDPQSVTPELLADIHRYTAQNHPQILSEVLQNPTITDNLGDFAANERDNLRGALGGNMGGNPAGNLG